MFPQGGSITIIAVTTLYIKEGRMITPTDKDMCVISEELAKQNNLKIGDKISFNDYHDTENSKGPPNSSRPLTMSSPLALL